MNDHTYEWTPGVALGPLAELPTGLAMWSGWFDYELPFWGAVIEVMPTRPFIGERLMIRSGEAWIIHDITVSRRSVLPGPIPGRQFSNDFMAAPLQLGMPRCDAGQMIAITVSYIGNNPDGEMFYAALVGREPPPETPPAPPAPPAQRRRTMADLGVEQQRALIDSWYQSVAPSPGGSCPGASRQPQQVISISSAGFVLPSGPYGKRVVVELDGVRYRIEETDGKVRTVLRDPADLAPPERARPGKEHALAAPRAVSLHLVADDLGIGWQAVDESTGKVVFRVRKNGHMDCDPDGIDL